MRRPAWVFVIVVFSVVFDGSFIHAPYAVAAPGTSGESIEWIGGDVGVPKSVYERWRSAGRAAIGPAAKWPAGIVPYAFDEVSDRALTTQERSRVVTAMGELASVANIRFFPSSPGAGSLTIRRVVAADHFDGGGFYFSACGVGYCAGGGELALAANTGSGVVKHELLHALGFWHEQERSDRESYVHVEAANIRPGMESQFDTQANTATGPYDLSSIMHYGACAWSRCGANCSSSNPACRTITVLDPTKQSRIGQLWTLSELDSQGLNRLYPRNPELYAVDVQVDGRIVVVGQELSGDATVATVQRLDRYGNLDSTFGPNRRGFVRMAFNGLTDNRVRAVGIQSDGKIVVAGDVNNGSTPVALVARLDAFGNLDPTFGPGGRGFVTAAFGGTPDNHLNDVFIQADQKIVVVGHVKGGPDNDRHDVALIARFDTAGNLDPGFGGGKGYQTLEFGGVFPDYLTAVDQAPGGPIVVAGYVRGGPSNNRHDVALVAYFDNSGNLLVHRTLEFGGLYPDYLKALAVMSDGRAVVGGFVYEGATPRGVVARFTGGGDLDPSFGGGTGYNVFPLALGTSWVDAILLQPDGSVVAAGKAIRAGTSREVAMSTRLTASGARDGQWGPDGSGFALHEFTPVHSRVTAIDQRIDGKPLVVGYGDDGNRLLGFVATLTSTGALDNSFGRGCLRFADGSGSGGGCVCEPGEACACGDASPLLCVGEKIRCVNKKQAATMKCWQRCTKTPESGCGAALASCVADAWLKFAGDSGGTAGCMSKAEQRQNADIVESLCLTIGDADERAAEIAAFVEDVAQAVSSSVPPPHSDQCALGKQRCIEKKLAGALECQRACLRDPSRCGTSLITCLAKGDAKFHGPGGDSARSCFARVESKQAAERPETLCATTGDREAIGGEIDAFVAAMVARLSAQ